eukprot:TRINITY_DN2040_c0_g1_i15.p1 TRINITY_DN2040_c0_g1~~TRINITY_DN2040_c0_g1_i15.p1  ORF type:complete len:361 (+),score=75.41 TRINITY_DN2040_c0_g1_i15:152-1234(+)
MAQIISDDLKLQRVKAVSGLKGSRHLTVLALSLYQPISAYLRDSLVGLTISLNVYPRKNLLLLMDFVAIVIPNMLVLVYVDYIAEMTIATILLAATLRFLARKPILPWKPSNTPYKVIKAKTFTKVSLPFLSQTNSIALIATSISILFVDFLVYPRCLVKTETYGVSLMDIGTGSILFISGISYALIEVTTTGSSRIARALRHNLVVLAIGVGRTVAVKVVNYQEHVSEYGVHWNFFLTIAVVSTLVALFPKSWQPFAHYIAIAIMICYECLLKFTKLEEYIISDMDRVTLLDKNKEGVFQCIGYLSCYLTGLGLGELCKKLALERRSNTEFLKALVKYTGTMTVPVSYTHLTLPTICSV